MPLFHAQIEIVYNNAGYISYTQEDAYYNIWDDSEPADTLQTFQKPPGATPPPVVLTPLLFKRIIGNIHLTLFYSTRSMRHTPCWASTAESWEVMFGFLGCLWCSRMLRQELPHALAAQ